MGLGALVAWSNLVRYFEFSPRFYVLVLTLERSMPDILRFMASCIPVLMGYAPQLPAFSAVGPECCTAVSRCVGRQ
jgi:hypothetical protein